MVSGLGLDMHTCDFLIYFYLEEEVKEELEERGDIISWIVFNEFFLVDDGLENVMGREEKSAEELSRNTHSSDTTCIDERRMNMAISCSEKNDVVERDVCVAEIGAVEVFEISEERKEIRDLEGEIARI